MRILSGLVLAAAAAGDAWNRAKSLRARDDARRDRRRLTAGDAKDCASNNPTLPRAAERFKTRLAAATAGCHVVVYTTLFYPPGVRLPHPSTRLGPAAYNGSAGECYLIVAGTASAAALREHCDVSPWRIVEMGGFRKGVHGRAASRTLKLLPGDYFTGVRYLVFLDWKLSLRQHPFDLVSRTLRSGDYGFAAFRHPCTTPSAWKHESLCRRPASVPWWRQELCGNQPVCRVHPTILH